MLSQDGQLGCMVMNNHHTLPTFFHFTRTLFGHAWNPQEADEVVEIGYLNALFVVARSIGLIGHALDQVGARMGLWALWGLALAKMRLVG